MNHVRFNCAINSNQLGQSSKRIHAWLGFLDAIEVNCQKQAPKPIFLYGMEEIWPCIIIYYVDSPDGFCCWILNFKTAYFFALFLHILRIFSNILFNL